ncbi:hypothetical protein ONZ51_g2341 [Trametes cubensis]|uniref:Uncharacterized protein n=1 Tax=Trametes cubensis TaxID=1111947 RepID=A0AAD7TZR0_9APHY|nr:hypothetical protein ONZ51_g2341 [Trametes cubensis]
MMPTHKPTYEPLDPFDQPLPQAIVDFAKYKPLPYPACSAAADDYFAVWRVRTQDLLGACGRWSIITGEDSCPTIAEDMSAEEKARTKRRIDRWKQRDREARFLILQKLADGYVPESAHCATAKELWDRILEDHSSMSGSTRVFRIYKRMIDRARHCPPDMSLVKRVTKYMEDNAALRELGGGMDDATLALMALTSFPTDDEVVRIKINSLDKEDTTDNENGQAFSTKKVMQMAAELDALHSMWPRRG